MKGASILATLLWSLTSAAVIVTVPATLTKENVESTLAFSAATSTINLERRAKNPAAEPTEEAEESPRSWLRTRTLASTTIVELVTPTVWGGVTFNASPRVHPKTPLPWLSLDKEGKVKTISPKLKNGITQNGRPEYGTWFDEAVTKTVNVKSMIDGYDDDHHVEDVQYIAEDTTDRDLNPLIRCTPDRYFEKKRKNMKIPSEPFCTPKEGSRLFLGNIYWVSWYTKYFPGAKNVRLHLAYVKPNKNGRGVKRDYIPDESISGLSKRDADDAFWSSEWLPNLDGVYPLEIINSMFEDKPSQDVMLTVQPDTIDDINFTLTNGTHLQIFRKPIKTQKNARLRVEDEGSSESALYIALTIPTLLVVVFFFFIVFNFLVRGNRSWRSIRVKSRKSGKIFSRNSKYSKLPSNNYELDRFD